MAKKKIDTPRSFAHDSNARNSANIIKLRLAHGAAGYGVYFMLLERLRDSPDYQAVTDYDILAYDLREDPKLIRSVIEDFGLFTLSDDGRVFFSETLSSRLHDLYAPKAAKNASEVTEPAAIPDREAEPEPKPECDAEPAPSAAVDTSLPDIQNLIDRTCSDGRWLAEVANKYDCTSKYIIKKLRNEIRNYCLDNAVVPSSMTDFRSIVCDWMDGKI